MGAKKHLLSGLGSEGVFVRGWVLGFCLEHCGEGFAHGGGGFGYGDAGGFEGFDFGGGGAFASGDDGSGVAHAAAGRGGGSGDEAGDGLLAVLGGPGGGFFFGGAADFTDHDDGFGLGVFVEHFEDVEVAGAVDWVAADAYAGALADAELGELVDGFVGEGAGAGDDADVAFFVDVAGGDADAAAAVGVFSGAGGDEAGAVWSDEAGLAAFHGGADAHHVDDGDAFGDADDEVEPGVYAFKDGVGGEGRWDEDGGDGGSTFCDSLVDGVENGDDVFERLSAFSGGDAGDDFGAVIE